MTARAICRCEVFLFIASKSYFWRANNSAAFSAKSGRAAARVLSGNLDIINQKFF